MHCTMSEGKGKHIHHNPNAVYSKEPSVSTTQPELDYQENIPVHVFSHGLSRQALDSVSKGQRKLDLAQRLTGALSSENDRWAENVIQLRADMELLTGDVLLAASFIRYSSGHPIRNRKF